MPKTSDKPRKKICSKCGKSAWIKSGYYRADDSYCKECHRLYQRERYAKTRKVPDGIRYDPEKGYCWEHKGVSKRIHWSAPMIEKLRRMYPTTLNEDCAIELGMSARTINRKAKELGIAKNPEWLKSIYLEHCKTMNFFNRCRGNKGQYAKGNAPHNKGITKKQTT